jgi:hypothetical protein
VELALAEPLSQLSGDRAVSGQVDFAELLFGGLLLAYAAFSEANPRRNICRRLPSGPVGRSITNIHDLRLSSYLTAIAPLRAHTPQLEAQS